MENLPVPGMWSVCLLRKNLAGPLGIPECRPPIRRLSFMENLPVPGMWSVCLLRKNLAGPLGIPECRPPIRRLSFMEKGYR